MRTPRSGAHCEYPALKCPDVPLWCYNGGTCRTIASGTTLCECTPQWAGGFCQTVNNANSSGHDFTPASQRASPPGTVAVPTWVAAPIIIGLVLILCLGGAVCYMGARERRGRPVFQPLESSGSSPTRRQELVRRASDTDA